MMSDDKGVWVKQYKPDWYNVITVLISGFFVCLFYSWQADWFEGGFNNLKSTFGFIGLGIIIILFIILAILESENSKCYEYVWTRKINNE